MTPLHEELHNKLKVNHDYVPNTLLFQLLIGEREDNIVSLRFTRVSNLAYYNNI